MKLGITNTNTYPLYSKFKTIFKYYVKLLACFKKSLLFTLFFVQHVYINFFQISDRLFIAGQP